MEEDHRISGMLSPERFLQSSDGEIMNKVRNGFQLIA